MRFFHLADLHLGKVLSGFSLLEDQRHILREIVRHAETERPDAVLIAGDVYDRQTPSAEAVRLLDDFLTALSDAVPHVLLISGNHDAPDRLGYAGRLMAARGVHVYGRFDGTVHTVRLTDAHGPCDIHLLPFLRAAHLRALVEGLQVTTCGEAVAHVLLNHALDPAARHVLVCHQFVTAPGAEPALSDSETGAVGGLDAVDARLLDAFDYVALGHLHAPQRMGRDTVRYAGSPLKYSASEHLHHKCLTAVALGPKGDVRISNLPLTPKRDLRMLAGPFDALIAMGDAPAVNPHDYLHITLTDEDEPENALARLRAVYPNILTLAYDNRRTRQSLTLQDAQPAQLPSPGALFEALFAMQNGAPPGPAQQALFARLMGGGEADA